jgi:hypothetical protein
LVRWLVAFGLRTRTHFINKSARGLVLSRRDNIIVPRFPTKTSFFLSEIAARIFQEEGELFEREIYYDNKVGRSMIDGQLYPFLFLTSTLRRLILIFVFSVCIYFVNIEKRLLHLSIRKNCIRRSNTTSGSFWFLKKSATFGRHMIKRIHDHNGGNRTCPCNEHHCSLTSSVSCFQLNVRDFHALNASSCLECGSNGMISRIKAFIEVIVQKLLHSWG